MKRARFSSLQALTPADLAALAARVRETVEAIGTQDEAAEVAGISTRQIKKYVGGEGVPPLPVAAALTRSAGYDLEWLATGLGQRERAAPASLLIGLTRALCKVYWKRDIEVESADLEKAVRMLAHGLEYAPNMDPSMYDELIGTIARSHEHALPLKPKR
ncbi:MAG TPA: helix-turn-helix transcriptional regulator [Polyangiaceae bacterium]|nr:helix-turn-helix transcriptional regulator [Polyangiaceae bacterium]